jgi:3-oxoacyl-[acyl-carrier protein] reductase
MSDYLVYNKTARSVVKTLGLPLPLPQPLSRPKAPLKGHFLTGHAVYHAEARGSELGPVLHGALEDTGAQVIAAGDAAVLDQLPEDLRPHGIVYDATGIDSPEALRALYDFFHPHIRSLDKCGRVVLLTRPPEVIEDPAKRAAQRAVEGFTRSVAKEVGRKGATANVILVDPGAEDRLESPLRFFLSNASAYVSGQPIHVSGWLPEKPARNWEQPLSGKVALVTGAAQGIGEGTARALAREGAKVIVMDRPPELSKAKAVAEEIGGTALGCDITDEAAAKTILAHVEEHYDGLDIVVHNAGVTRDRTLANMSDDKWDMVLAVNLIGLIRTNEALLPKLRDGGRIVAMSSIGGIAGNVGQTNYASTKAGLIGYVQGLAPTAYERNITVNAIAPGFIETDMTAAMPMATREVARRLSNLSQGGQPQDIAEAIAFLASPNTSGVTGQVLRVCGGNLMGA